MLCSVTHNYPIFGQNSPSSTYTNTAHILTIITSTFKRDTARMAQKRQFFTTQTQVPEDTTDETIQQAGSVATHKSSSN
jgi:hypothetical protein